VYGWSLPSIRDVYRFMLLGTDSIDAAAEARNGAQAPSPTESADSTYSPPTMAEIARNGKGSELPTPPPAEEIRPNRGWRVG
tara:strand:- start:910 stop:1155 length:246 start_codon:yes stop_codon:yes gene_type:complete